MHWEALGAIGETVGAMAVVASLVYLATQIRTQNKEARIAAAHELTKAQREASRIFLEPDVAEDFLAVIGEFDSATPAQRLRVTQLLIYIWRGCEDAYLQHLEGRLDSDLWYGQRTQLADLMANKTCRSVWTSRNHQFDKRFRAFVDDLAPGTELYGS